MTGPIEILVVLEVLAVLLAGAEPEPAPPPVPAVVEVEADPVLTGDAARIAACESGARLADGTARLGTHRWDADNPSSSASGAFQFVDSTWRWTWELAGTPAPTVRARDATPADQLAAFEVLWDGGAGAAHWRPSESCWGRM